jgi:hypothetical protein
LIKTNLVIKPRRALKCEVLFSVPEMRMGIVVLKTVVSPVPEVSSRLGGQGDAVVSGLVNTGWIKPETLGESRHSPTMSNPNLEPTSEVD